LEALQTRLLSGDQSFIDKLWINHHIEKRRGLPNIFMTVSCAEYFWPDRKKLLEKYIYLTEGYY
jgi:hypothetical protein